MTSFQLFKGMTGIDSEFLLQVEGQDFPASRRMHIKKLWLIAAIVALTLLLVGCAVVYATILWDSPKEMIAGLYGENTDFDSAAPGKGSSEFHPRATWTIPGYEKRPVEETVAQELEKWVSPVGKSISAPGYKLTVDAYVYDNATQCGFMTMLLEHDKPIPEDMLLVNYDGYIAGLDGLYLNFNQDAYPYLISEKTTDHLLAFTVYFRADLEVGTEMLVSFPNSGRRDDTDEMLCVSLPDSGSLPYRTFGQGDIYVNSLCVRIRTSDYTEWGDSVETLIFHMTDGTDFVVTDDLTDNTVFKRIIEHDDLLYMLNSAINIDKIQSVEVVGEFGSTTLEGD